MKKQTIIKHWDAEVCEMETKTTKKVLSLPVFELSNDEYLHIISADWFSEEFYSLIKKHNFSVVVKNIQTGESTAIRTFGARFPLLVSKVA